MATPEYHAKLSPSSAGRWLRCPASVRLSVNVPDTASEYAEAGRLAHSIAELKARKKFTVMKPSVYKKELAALRAAPQYDPAMEDATDRYLEVLTEQAMSFATKPAVALETPVPIGLVTGETKEDGGPATGTADCIQIGGGELWITDYKNGAGVPVSAVENPQMMLYALGALALYRPFYGDSLQTVRMTIVQPALDNVSTWKTTPVALADWACETVAPAAALALSGTGGEPAPGDWCQSHFCPVRATCKARAYEYLALEAFAAPAPALLTTVELADVLTRAKGLAAWVAQVEDYALTACLDGVDIPGYKAVEGCSLRAWRDTDAAFAALTAAGWEEALLYERKPLTLASIEKLLGKKEFSTLLAEHIVKPAGKPTLVPETDSRPAYNAAQLAFGGAN